MLDHSLESAKLVTGFDVSTLVLLLERPEVQMRSLAPGAMSAAAIFLLAMLMIDGGVLAVYLEDRKLSREEFFGSCGLYFWRMVRLALYSMVPFGMLMAAGGAVASHAGKLSHDAPQERLGFFVNVASKLAIVLIALLRALVVRSGAGAGGASRRTQNLAGAVAQPEAGIPLRALCAVPGNRRDWRGEHGNWDLGVGDACRIGP